MSVSSIPEKVKTRLWGKAGGRCQYEGCREPLWQDGVTQCEFNISYIAHIIADKPDGPRGNKRLSAKLAADINNLMLLCDVHHRLVDKEDVAGHPATRLREMKADHEARIELATSIGPEMQSEVLLYGARIGHHEALVSWDKAARAMLAQKRLPLTRNGIALGMQHGTFDDREGRFWRIEAEHLKRKFRSGAAERLRDVPHFSIFALAPQPLLILLGSLLPDLRPADVYQLHREPPTWEWQPSPAGFKYKVSRPSSCHSAVALKIGLSATITQSRLSHAMEGMFSTWGVTIDNPNNDFLQGHEQLAQFRVVLRRTLDRIKAQHGEKATIHLFPAMPVAAAVEFGRVLMPKADLPVKVYDQNREKGFRFALEVNPRRRRKK